MSYAHAMSYDHSMSYDHAMSDDHSMSYAHTMSSYILKAKKFAESAFQSQKNLPPSYIVLAKYITSRRFALPVTLFA